MASGEEVRQCVGGHRKLHVTRARPLVLTHFTKCRSGLFGESVVNSGNYKHKGVLTVGCARRTCHRKGLGGSVVMKTI